ncbi:hypothetical protein GLOIN_2v1479934 [Rhizophagus irregularis DAOM 181602=DAOM 197198]|uniref:Uncharacterized protein n=1 Tax=Rhizophagus irregularis (strain DAOM 181602 / DAOM 197198 / MUCL 43194) TaxID=747089 RepID=A0A2P4PW27_RHIID|nr:hypothetical protein GLOIN_2v1479934 [Rhizophagus irregularis DAOM 181602=DAOM 197198]POG69581.1 hypothetical protein GLOIN_2v1479934 [Rhizophagus irregularis DAOM 181602=DAOM 197198]|eukprot:XP_025176447.1 hypothetical protein GLOIN_2v1479934 [Rhizophagus irregularis DAOM 181602=DAOM 197198]
MFANVLFFFFVGSRSPPLFGASPPAFGALFLLSPFHFGPPLFALENRFFFGLILNRRVSIIKLAGFPFLELYWMGGFSPWDFIGWADKFRIFETLIFLLKKY